MSVKVDHSRDTYVIRCDQCSAVIPDYGNVYRLVDMRPNFTGLTSMSYEARGDYCSFWCVSVVRSRLILILAPGKGPLG